MEAEMVTITMPCALDDELLERQQQAAELSTLDVSESIAPASAGCWPWLKSRILKYFCHGQLKTHDAETGKGPAPEGSSWFYTTFVWNRPRAVTTFLPLSLVLIAWLIIFIRLDLWHLYTTSSHGKLNADDKPVAPHVTRTEGWRLTLMMLFGSLVAGATSEGGGSIAFPVMTLILGLPSSMSRDFSLLIQSIGMTSGSFTIWYAEILFETFALMWVSLGGVFGITVGLYFVADSLPDEWSKMLFVSIFLAFAITLFVLNREKGRVTHTLIRDRSRRTIVVLLITGFIGGNLSAISGSGIDICTFSVLTLYFRLSEKTATPTSVILMAGNTVVGFFIRAAVQRTVERETFAYFACAAIVVPFGAPMGAFLSSFLHRQVLASVVYITDSGQFILACAVVSMNLALALSVPVVVLSALVVFFGLKRAGTHRLAVETESLPTTLMTRGVVVDGLDMGDRNRVLPIPLPSSDDSDGSCNTEIITMTESASVGSEMSEMDRI